MNIADYWPMDRKYSIWNATVAALQLWTADLEAHVLSSAIEQVYNAFFIPHLHIYYASSQKKFYLVAL